jgi:hypothetical protein
MSPPFAFLFVNIFIYQYASTTLSPELRVKLLERVALVDEAEIAFEFSFISFQLSCSRVAVALRRWTNGLRFEVFTAVTMNNVVFWDVAPYRSCVNRRFGGTYRLHLQGRKISERRTSVNKWLQPDTSTTHSSRSVNFLPSGFRIRDVFPAFLHLFFLRVKRNAALALLLFL